MSFSGFARQDDITYGYCNVCEDFRSGKVQAFSTHSYCEDKLIARVGDNAKCDVCGSTGVIQANNSKVFVEEKRMARKDDAFVGVYSGTITSGASKSLDKI